MRSEFNAMKSNSSRAEKEENTTWCRVTEKKHLKFDDQVKEAARVVIFSFTTRLFYLCHETEKK